MLGVKRLFMYYYCGLADLYKIMCIWKFVIAKEHRYMQFIECGAYLIFMNYGLLIQ